MISQLLYFAALVTVSSSLCTTRGITVTGTVVCDEFRQENVAIELREHDTFTPDDSLAKVQSNSKGDFKVFGEDCEIGNIEPYLRITHACDNGVVSKKCTITDDFPIPKEYVGKTYSMGVVSLNIARTNRKKNCKD